MRRSVLQIAVAFVEALGKDAGDQTATESFVRHAVFSPGNKNGGRWPTKNSRPRPSHRLRAASLVRPGYAIGVVVQRVLTDGDGSVHYTHTLFREGQDSDWSYDLRLSAVQYDWAAAITRTTSRQIRSKSDWRRNGAKPTELAKRDKLTSRYINRYGNAAAAAECKSCSAK